MGRCSFLLWLLISALLAAAAGSSSPAGTGLGRKVLENPDSEVAASFPPDHLVVDHGESTGNWRHLAELNDYNSDRSKVFPPGIYGPPSRG